MLLTTRTWRCASAVLLLGAATLAHGQGEGGSGVTRLLLTQVRVKPSQVDSWRVLQRDQVVPALMNFVREEMMPPMREAQQNGTSAGLIVTTSVQGGEPNIITLNMFYNDFAPLDGPPPVAKTLGPAGTAEFLRKGAGLITQLEQFVLERVAELSYERV